MEDTNALLTSTQREFLEAPEDEYSRQSRNYHEKNIHARIRAGIADFNLIYDHFDPGDWQEVRWSAIQDDASAITTLASGEEAIVALIYESSRYTPGRDFEQMLQNAMHRVARRNDWQFDENTFSFTAEFDRDPNFVEMEERFRLGEATVGEATMLFRRDRIDRDEFVDYIDDSDGPE